MYTPVNPSFTIQKCGLRGVKIIKVCFRDESIQFFFFFFFFFFVLLLLLFVLSKTEEPVLR